jgi:hypothetical protein
LKRTRRIEVVRYSQRVTVIQGESAAVDKAAEQQAGDLILEVLAGIPPKSEQGDFDASAPSNPPTDHPPRCRSLVRLGDLLRLRGRR